MNKYQKENKQKFGLIYEAITKEKILPNKNKFFLFL